MAGVRYCIKTWLLTLPVVSDSVVSSHRGKVTKLLTFAPVWTLMDMVGVQKDTQQGLYDSHNNHDYIMHVYTAIRS